MKRIKIKRRGHKNPKAKGSAYERRVCKRLSLWVSGMKRTDVFWRSASSGGRFTQLHRPKMAPRTKSGRRRETLRGLNDDAHAGDITLTHESGAAFIRSFVVECKHMKESGLRMLNLLFGRKSGVGVIWAKLLTECMGGRMPFLAIRQNCQPEIVVLSQEGYKLLRHGGKLPVTGRFPQKGMVVVLLRDVLTLDFSKIKRKVSHA
jgi:hypothetical protein